MLVALLCTIYCGIPQLDTLSTIAWPRTSSAMVRAARTSACLYHIAMLFPDNFLLFLFPIAPPAHLPEPHPPPHAITIPFFFSPSTSFHVLYSMCFPFLPNPSISPTPPTPSPLPTYPLSYLAHTVDG